MGNKDILFRMARVLYPPSEVLSVEYRRVKTVTANGHTRSAGWYVVWTADTYYPRLGIPDRFLGANVRLAARYLVCTFHIQTLQRALPEASGENA